jgi:4-hydroxy-3-polyprenylbenzoate decarboxylase
MSRDLRTWIEKLEAEEELKRIKAQVDWDGEIAEIQRRALEERGPALLFDNIKGYENTWCQKLFMGGLIKSSYMALMLGLSKDTPRQDILQLLRRRFKEPIEPERVDTGPVKENIIKGNNVDIFQLPVPKWHPLDGGRYINSWLGVVTRDPDDGTYNVGQYRGMIIGKDKISVFLIPAQGWGTHFSKYQRMGKPMPIALVFGWDPSMGFTGALPLSNINEYQAMGAIMQEPVPLLKCEASDLEVPASAEIVVEGTISPDPSIYEMEGPFGEASGLYSRPEKRPVIKVDCITFRNDPIYRGSLAGVGMVTEDIQTFFMGQPAIMMNTLELQGIPGILDIVPMPIVVVKIRKTYQGQPRQVAAALWGSKVSVNMAKIVMVVEEDVDINNPRALLGVLLSRVDPEKDVIVFPMNMGSSGDPARALEEGIDMRYGSGIGSKLLIDATIDWTTHPVREEWGSRRLPPSPTHHFTEAAELVKKRWQEYGF